MNKKSLWYNVFADLAAADRRIVLALDELPILVNKLLRDENGVVTPQGRQRADEFLSWLRKIGQAHGERVTLILSGSIGLEPILEQNGLSTNVNIFAPYELKPWSESTAANCLSELATTYGIDLPQEVRLDMCRRLGCCIPHHVQLYFDKMHSHLRGKGLQSASLDDSRTVYRESMLGVHANVGMVHYEHRLETTLGSAGYRIAHDFLTYTAAWGRLEDDVVKQCRDHLAMKATDSSDADRLVKNVLLVLGHDGYLVHKNGGRRFVSAYLKDWWRNRHQEFLGPANELAIRMPGEKQ